MTNVVVFASGRGSGFESLMRRQKEGRLKFNILALVSDVPGCGALSHAGHYGVPSVVVAGHEYKNNREAHEGKIFEALHTAVGVDVIQDPRTWLVLSGYMRLLSKNLIQKLWRPELQAARIVNIHPSLLPSFPGMHAYKQALDYGVKVTGATVHLVTEGLDDGPIVMQRPLLVEDNDTEESLSRRGHALEHELYATALNALAGKGWYVETRGRPRVVFERQQGGTEL